MRVRKLESDNCVECWGNCREWARCLRLYGAVRRWMMVVIVRAVDGSTVEQLWWCIVRRPQCRTVHRTQMRQQLSRPGYPWNSTYPARARIPRARGTLWGAVILGHAEICRQSIFSTMFARGHFSFFFRFQKTWLFTFFSEMTHQKVVKSHQQKFSPQYVTKEWSLYSM